MGRIDDLFGMKWILPEHAKLLNEHYHLDLSGKYVSKPVKEEDELLEFNFSIQRSLHDKVKLTIVYWKHFNGKLGELRSETGIVKVVDQNRGQLKIESDDDDFTWISITDVVRIEEV